jgi:hypothetical protein
MLSFEEHLFTGQENIFGQENSEVADSFGSIKRFSAPQEQLVR